MYAEVIQLREEGRLIPRWQLAAHRTMGQLAVGEAFDPGARRMVRSARLTARGQFVVLPSLRGAQLLYINGDRLILTGYQADMSVVDKSRLFAQAWEVRASDEASCQAWWAEAERQGRISRWTPLEREMHLIDDIGIVDRRHPTAPGPKTG